jgi:hypothetical protein
MPSSATEIRIPNVKLEFEDLLALILRLDGEARQRIAQALADFEMDSRLGKLIQQIADKPATNALDDAEIASEVQAVRQARRSA